MIVVDPLNNLVFVDCFCLDREMNDSNVDAFIYLLFGLLFILFQMSSYFTL